MENKRTLQTHSGERRALYVKQIRTLAELFLTVNYMKEFHWNFKIQNKQGKHDTHCFHHFRFHSPKFYKHDV